jgi:hypothetical protein
MITKIPQLAHNYSNAKANTNEIRTIHEQTVNIGHDLRKR